MIGPVKIRQLKGFFADVQNFREEIANFYYVSLLI